MTVKPAQLALPIFQGATFRESLIRANYPYLVRIECDQPVKLDGSTAPASDATPEDYTGCTARMQLREDIDSSEVLWEMSTDDGRIELDGNTLTLVFDAADSSSFAFDSAVGHVEVTRPNGDVERQYEIKFKVSREGTR